MGQPSRLALSQLDQLARPGAGLMPPPVVLERLVVNGRRCDAEEAPKICPPPLVARMRVQTLVWAGWQSWMAEAGWLVPAGTSTPAGDDR